MTISTSNKNIVIFFCLASTMGQIASYPMLTASMLKEFPKTVGVAASFSGAIQIAGSGVIIYIVALLNLETILHLASSFLVVSVLMLILMFLIPKESKNISS